MVRHLDTDSALARNGGDDANAQCGKAQRDVALQVLDFGNAHAVGRNYLEKCDGRTHAHVDLLDWNVVVGKRLGDTALVFLLLVDIHVVAVHFALKQ